MIRILIVEGPDGAGKTTLANKLADKYDLTVPKWDRDTMSETSEVERRTYFYLTGEVASDAPPFVLDRFYISELVYGHVLRQRVCFNAFQQQFIEGVLKVINPPIIFCMPPLETVQANVSKDDQMEGVEDNVDLIYHEYDQQATYFRLCGFRTIRYDYTRADEPNHSLIEAYLDERKHRQW